MFEFILWAAGVVLTFWVAEKNGRNKWVALVFGLVFSWGAAIVYGLMGRTFEKKLEQANALSKAMEVKAPSPEVVAPVAPVAVVEEKKEVVAEAAPVEVKKARKPRAKKTAVKKA